MVATLALLHDLTANADAAHPAHRAAVGRSGRATWRCWAAGRASWPGDAGRGDRDGSTCTPSSSGAVAGADPTEVVALERRPGRPGRPALLRRRPASGSRCSPRELRSCAAHAGEPLLDLVRRIIDTTGIDVELASSVSPAARARRDNLDLFVKAVAEFQAIDGDGHAARRCWPTSAPRTRSGNGLDVATPTEADSVKLLTVHRAKGLEWDAVFLVGVCAEKFPTNRDPLAVARPRVDAARRRCAATRADLPPLRGWTTRPTRRAQAPTRAPTRREEELRLGYVAFTRARHLLWVSSYVWRHGRASRSAPRLTSGSCASCCSTGGRAVALAGGAGRRAARTRCSTVDRAVPWPVTEQTAEALRRLEAAELVRDAMAAAAATPRRRRELDLVESSLVAEWDAELERLLAEARRDRADAVDVPLPSSLSATSVARLRDDPEQLARRAGPADAAAAVAGRPVRHPVPRLGRGPLRPAGAGRPRRAARARRRRASTTRTTSRELVAAFEQGRSRTGTPVAVEPPFALVLGGQVVRGRIDAVYAEQVDGSDGFLVVDWKTNRAQTADPLAARDLPGGLGRAGRRAASSGSGRRSTTCAPATSWSPTGLESRAELEELLHPGA